VSIDPNLDLRGGILISFNLQMADNGVYRNISTSLSTKIVVREGIVKG